MVGVEVVEHHAGQASLRQRRASVLATNSFNSRGATPRHGRPRQIGFLQYRPRDRQRINRIRLIPGARRGPCEDVGTSSRHVAVAFGLG